MASHIDDDAVAAADKEMEARANRAKELLSQRYHGLKKHQVCATERVGIPAAPRILTHTPLSG